MAEPIRKIEKYYRTGTTKVGHLWKDNEAAHRGFNGLKAALANAPVLATPDFTRPFIILSDASKHFIGAVLAQRDSNGIERPIAYMSRALRGAELNYAITDAEGLALVVALRQWRHYVASSPTLCITDHVALKSLVGSKEHASSRQARYALDLRDFFRKI